MIINIRGTNGSGKTHLARQLISPDPVTVDLNWYDAPTKADPTRQKRVEGWGHPDEVLAIGSYKQGCGGMDTIPSFAAQQRAIDYTLNTLLHPPRDIIAEGVLASTVAGSWLEYFSFLQAQGRSIVIAYLDTPIDLCLERITARQIAATGEAREIKTDQVRDKVRAIAATEAKFIAAGIPTIKLRHDNAHADLMGYLNHGA